MTFVMPNFTLEGQDPSTYKAMLDYFCALAQRQALSFSPHEQDTPNMTVRLEAGAILSGVTLTEVAAQSTATITAPSTHPRVDRIVIDRATGAASVVAGTEASSPSAPAIPSGKLPVAQVLLTVGKTSITNADLTDERVGGSSVDIVQNLASPSATDVPSTQAVVNAIAAIPQQDTNARNNIAFESFLNQLGLGRATGVIPNGMLWTFYADDLAAGTKTNATYDAAGDYYHNPAGYSADLCTGGTAIESNHQGAYAAANAFDGNDATYWGSEDPIAVGTTFVGYILGSGSTMDVDRITLLQATQNYITSCKIYRADNALTWTEVCTKTIAAGANTLDSIGITGARGFKIVANGTYLGGGGIGIGAGWGVKTVNAYKLNVSGNMTLVPLAATANASPKTARLCFLHKAVDASTLNTDITIEATNNDGTNYVAGTISLVCAYDADYNMMLATVTFAATGTAPKWRIKTFNGKCQRLKGVRMTWE